MFGSSSEATSAAVWGWLGKAQSQAYDMASKASERATEFAKQTKFDAAAQVLLKGVGLSSTPHDAFIRELEEKKVKPESGRVYSRDELDLTYVTENMISMSYPNDYSVKSKIQGGNDIEIVAGYLNQYHKGRYMIWNISEESYDYTRFNEQVLEYRFPGHPAPPLGLMFKICTSVESWLNADRENVAVVHCLTGKGRTTVVMACILTWIGEFLAPMEALQYIAERRGLTIEALTIPSQRRYIQYFSNILDGVKPRSEAMVLRRCILHSIPKFSHRSDDAGCCPYIQIFKNGKLLANASLIPPNNTEHTIELQWLSHTEGSAAFKIDCIVQGDILVRCRHAENASRVSMFRAAFHTGYVPGNVLRLTKAQLDGPNNDDRFPDDFLIDLIFAPIEKGDEVSVSDSGATVDAKTADKYESMLHRDNRFWESVAARKTKKKPPSRIFATVKNEKFSIGDDVLPAEEEEFHVRGETNPNGVSDMDLIMQLTQAANDDQPTERSETKEGSSSATMELRALDDLEKELGIDFSSSKQSVVDDGTMESLDDLEKYLESLSTNG